MPEVPPYAQIAKAQMRDAILDAAYDLVVARGWSAAKMTDVAARVSRQTLYNEFGSKEGLAREACCARAAASSRASPGCWRSTTMTAPAGSSRRCGSR